MKIAVCYNLPFGGAKRAMHEMVKRLARRHELDFYSINAETTDGLEIAPFVRRVIVTPGPLPKPGWGMLSGLAGIRRTYKAISGEINRGGYDLALISQCQLTQSPYVLRYLKIPSVYYCQESSNRHLEPHAAPRGRLGWIKRTVIWVRYRVVDRANARFATVICANSRYSVESINRAYGVLPRYCPLGVDADFFRPLNLSRRPEVLVVGSLTKAKAPEFVLESAATIPKPPPVRFIFNFSSASAPDDLQKRAGALGVNAAFDNMASDNDLLEAYNRSAIVAVPSIMEPMGFVSYEAMACATPVVGVAEGGVREAIQEGRTGFLTGRDPVKFGRAIKSLLDDRELCKRMGAAGREFVLEHRMWDKTCEILEESFKMAVEKRKGENSSQKSVVRGQ
jgi:glycosyltransferase involved in cell wall biosynthesis